MLCRGKSYTFITLKTTRVTAHYSNEHRYGERKNCKETTSKQSVRKRFYRADLFQCELKNLTTPRPASLATISTTYANKPQHHVPLPQFSQLHTAHVNVSTESIALNC